MMSAAAALSPIQQSALEGCVVMTLFRAAARVRRLRELELDPLVWCWRQSEATAEALAATDALLEATWIGLTLDRLLAPGAVHFSLEFSALLGGEAAGPPSLVDQDLTDCWVSSARPRVV